MAVGSYLHARYILFNLLTLHQGHSYAHVTCVLVVPRTLGDGGGGGGGGANIKIWVVIDAWLPLYGCRYSMGHIC
ncbi:unnamed protein product [Ilex paraguariensis]|uniref:Secreted protein n=1 Tax=Ilex paraguariensis TaxID=185542 RepID=A0ABC8RHA0_9AQUA